ncbi:CYFA0S19e01024g1_1 [Cyberlindnera fabianii]|uniref:CYFA0S19e01024g1_1 n=1 Tax=Cyberlindnera fabianii TaxID=36022 RepID=A0A061BCM9_CYBFA|nr:CYFA0S19e01024g1_1 [Cyberlindnera fabianii]
MVVSLAPLVLLNISDSVHRQLSPLGVLRGLEGTDGTETQQLSLINSFEVPLNEQGPDTVYAYERNTLMSQIYPEEGGIIGVYVVDSSLDGVPTEAVMLANELGVSTVLVFSPQLASNNDGKYFRVFNLEGTELKCNVTHSGEEAVNTVLALKEADATETSKSKDMVNTTKGVLDILTERTKFLTSALQNGLIKDYDTLRQINSLVSKLGYKADEDVKKELLDVENTYKLVLTTGLLHDTTQNLEKASLDARGVAHFKDAL